MFNFTDALSRRISKTQKESVQTNRMHRASANLPEKTVEPVSPETTARTRIPSPGLEPVKKDDDTLKEATSPEPALKETEYTAHAPGFDPRGPAHDNHRERNRRRKWPWLIGGLAIVIVLAIALGVGLGVGLKNNGSNNATSPAADLSTVGAFNGSGIALASQSFEVGGFGSIVLYFQHHSGQIRSAQLSTTGEWQGGAATDVVAVDAKNGTPIAAVSYSRDNIAAWHIFYININGSISEVTNSNKTNVWVPGPLNKFNLKPMDDPNVGLQACWYGGFYSDVAYNHSPVPGQSPNDSSTDSSVGIFLWYGSNPTTFQSSAWSYGSDDWTQQQDFKDYNAHAGVGCYSWGPGSVTYTSFVDLEDNLAILWKDSNASHKATTDHPVLAWTKSNVSIPVFQNSSLGYTNNLYYQNPDLTFSGVNISWDAEKTTAPLNDPAQSFVINGQKGLPGSRLSVTSLPNTSGGNSLLAFYQTNGSDITEFVRDFDAGQWTSSQVPIADA